MIARSPHPEVRVPLVRPYLGRLWHRWRDARRLSSALDLVPAILHRVEAASGRTAPSAWVPRWSRWSGTGVALIGLGRRGGAPLAVLKAASSRAGVAGLRAEAAALAGLSAVHELGAWRDLVPDLIGQGELSGWFYTIQRALPGRGATSLDLETGSGAAFLGMAADAIRPLHEATAVEELAGEWLLARDVDRHLRRIVRAVPSDLAVQRDPVARRVAGEVRETLAGRAVRLSWIHGDYWPGNLLVAPDGERIEGIVDWGMAEPRQLVLHDLLHLLIHTRQIGQGRELGDIVAELLDGGEWNPAERAVLEEADEGTNLGQGGERAMLILYWLRRIGAIFDQERGHSGNRVWMAWNVDRVLRCL